MSERVTIMWGVVLEVDVGFIHYKFLSCLSEGGESPGYAVCGSLVRGVADRP